MKVKFSKTVRFEPSFNGNTDLSTEQRFYADLSVLSTGDLLNVMDAFQTSGVNGKIDTDAVDIASMRSLLKLVPDLLPKYVTVHGLTDESGNDITVDDIIKHATFLPLQVELLVQLSVISTPTEQSEKNLNAPPA